MKWLWGFALVAFGASVFFPFIALDDAKHIWQNPYVANLSLEGLKQFWLKPYYGLYIPVVYSTWTLLAQVTQFLGLKHEVSGFSAPLFHLACVVTHLLNVYLLWHLLRRHFSEAAAVSVALVFAAHPLQTEAVAWASGLKDTLSTSLALIAWLAWQEMFLKNDPTLPRWLTQIRKRRLSLFLIAFVLALLTKPNVVVLPIAAWLWYQMLKQKIQVKPTWVVVATAIALWVVWLTKSSQPSDRLEFTIELWQRPLVAIASLGFYLSKWIFPWPLSPDYGLTPPAMLAHPWFYIWSVSGIALVALCAWALFKKKTQLALGSGLLILGLSPNLGLIPFEFQNLSTVADRYFYFLPAIGAGFLLASTLSLWPAKVKWATIALGTIWSALSLAQTLQWSSNEQLFSHTALHNPKSYLALNNLGLQAIRRNDFKEAEEQLKKALAVKPDYLAAIANLGVVYFKQQNFTQTVQHYSESLARLPKAGVGSPATFADMYFNLGAAQLNLGQTEAGSESLKQAVLINPDHFLARYHYGRVLAAKNQNSAAREQFLQALRLQPQDRLVLQELQKLPK